MAINPYVGAGVAQGLQQGLSNYNQGYQETLKRRLEQQGQEFKQTEADRADQRFYYGAEHEGLTNLGRLDPGLRRIYEDTLGFQLPQAGPRGNVWVPADVASAASQGAFRPYEIEEGQAGAREAGAQADVAEFQRDTQAEEYARQVAAYEQKQRYQDLVTRELEQKIAQAELTNPTEAARLQAELDGIRLQNARSQAELDMLKSEQEAKANTPSLNWEDTGTMRGIWNDEMDRAIKSAEDILGFSLLMPDFDAWSAWVQGGRQGGMLSFILSYNEQLRGEVPPEILAEAAGQEKPPWLEEGFDNRYTDARDAWMRRMGQGLIPEHLREYPPRPYVWAVEQLPVSQRAAYSEDILVERWNSDRQNLINELAYIWGEDLPEPEAAQPAPFEELAESVGGEDALRAWWNDAETTDEARQDFANFVSDLSFEEIQERLGTTSPGFLENILGRFDPYLDVALASTRPEVAYGPEVGGGIKAGAERLISPIFGGGAPAQEAPPPVQPNDSWWAAIRNRLFGGQ